jgi:hypothetical protein
MTPWISARRKSSWAAMVGLIGLLEPLSIVDGQRAPCASFDGPGRILYCGGKPAIYAIVEAVTFEPSEGMPERIRITGTFVLPVSNGGHLPPQRGSLYFSLVPERAVAIRKDWSDLAALAGTGRVVGFLEYWASRPMGPGDHAYEAGARRGTMNTGVVVSIHKPADEANPEPYPQHHELDVLTSFDRPADLAPRFGRPSAAIIAELQEAARR